MQPPQTLTSVSKKRVLAALYAWDPKRVSWEQHEGIHLVTALMRRTKKVWFHGPVWAPGLVHIWGAYRARRREASTKV